MDPSIPSIVAEYGTPGTRAVNFKSDPSASAKAFLEAKFKLIASAKALAVTVSHDRHPPLW